MRKISLAIVFALVFAHAFSTDAAAQTCVAPPAGLLNWFPGIVDSTNTYNIVGLNEGHMWNGLTVAPGKVGQAFSLDGIDDYMSTVYTIPGNTPATISAWIYGTSTTTAPIVKMGDHLSLFVNPADGIIVFGATQSSLASANQAVYASAVHNTVNVWTHVVGTWDGTTARLYVDGALQGENAVASGSEASLSAIETSVGYGIAGYAHFRGLIDEVQIFNRALTSDEIQAVFNADSAGICQNGAAPRTGAGPFAYLTITSPSKIAIVDTATNTVVSTRHLEFIAGPRSIAVSPDGASAYVAENGGKIERLDTSTNTVTASVAVSFPGAIALSPDGSRLYAISSTYLQNGSEIDQVYAIDVPSMSVSGSPLTMTPGIHAIAVSPDGSRVYVLGDEITAIDAATMTVVPGLSRSVGLAFFQGNMALSPDGSKAYVVDFPHQLVLTLDVTTSFGATLDSTLIGRSPTSLALSPDGSRLYTTNRDNTISVLGPSNGTGPLTILQVTQKPPSSICPEACVFQQAIVSPDAAHLYVTSGAQGGHRWVIVYDTATNALATSISVGSDQPVGIAMAPAAPVPSVDTTAPVVTLSAPAEVEAAGPDGSLVGFTTSAHDNVDGDVSVSCAVERCALPARLDDDPLHGDRHERQSRFRGCQRHRRRQDTAGRRRDAVAADGRSRRIGRRDRRIHLLRHRRRRRLRPGDVRSLERRHIPAGHDERHVLGDRHT